MYIKTGEIEYPCVGYHAWEDTIRYTLEAAPAELGETVGLYGDDGFELVTHRVAEWLRWEVQGNALVLTNLPVPEPGPPPEPVEPPMDTQAAMVQAIIDLQYEVDTMKLNGGMTV